MKKGSLLLAAAVLVCFLVALSRLDTGRQEKGRQQLEEALRRTAVSCYALEGAYPPSVEYMKEHYGLTYDGSRYTVHYSVFASNLMPEITVLDSKS